MVRLDRIYTRSGDEGQTSLGDGRRVPKTNPRIAAMGSVDELNASLGVAQAVADVPPEISELLTRVQNDLFDVGADLCVPIDAQKGERERLRLTEADVQRMEDAIDLFNARLNPLTSFILPGGTPAAATLHLARAQCRRAEIEVLRLHETEEVNRFVAVYLNRLSDLLFVLARVCNLDRGDLLWQPGGADRD
jgi:cob(I)alamin adenosyltransferase